MNRRTIICLLLITATTAAYGRVIHFTFVELDDRFYVTEVPQVTGGLTVEGIVWAFRHIPFGAWQPVLFMSHMLDCSLYGLNGGGHHLTSLLLHLFCTLGVFAIWDRMTGRWWPSAVVAALFALHPLHVESVAWVSTRKDVLSMTFGLLSIWTYVSYVRRGGVGLYLATALLLILSLATKQMLVTLPFVFLLLDYWPLHRVRFAGRSGRAPEASPPWRLRQRSAVSLVIEKVPLIVPAVAFTVLSYVGQSNVGSVHSLDTVPPLTRVTNATVSYALYLQKTVWPAELTVNYPHPNLCGGTPWNAWQISGAAARLGCITVVVLLVRRRYAVVGWLWFLGTLVPVIGIVFDGQVAMADRYAYVPLIGLYVIAAWSIDNPALRSGGWRGVVPSVVKVAVIVVLAACLVRTWQQTGHWRDNRALYEHAVNTPPVSASIHWDWAHQLHRDGRFDDAITHYRRALELSPHLVKVHLGLANALAASGRLDASIAAFLRTIEHAPDYADAHHDFGCVLMDAGRRSEAMKYFGRAVELNPDFAEAHYPGFPI